MEKCKRAHSLKEWLAVTRYWSFAVSSMPVIVTFAYLCSKGDVCDLCSSCINAALALVGTVLLHAAGNVLSDWADYRKGVDNEEACAVRNLVDGVFTPGEYLRFSILLFVAGAAVGLFLAFRTGPLLLAIGAAGIILTSAYSFLKYRALGDLDIFLIFSVLIILGTTFVVCGTIVPEALVLALPVGTITVSVLHANNTLDIETDRKAGIRTFAMLIGLKASCRLYQAYMLIPFICIVLSVVQGLLHPFTLLSLIALIPALKNFSRASHFKTLGVDVMKGLDQASSKLQLVFSGLLTIALFAAAGIAC